jgi:DNA-binding MarR family transcriptional regulator
VIGVSGASAKLPLSTLLSQTLVAFTIEFDNEAEHRIPHWTTNHGASANGGGLWLVSMAMYLNCMRFVGKEAITSAKVEELARTVTNWNGMERWRYVRIERPKKSSASWLVRATRKGLMAQEIWRPLFGVIEERWNKRFGREVIEQLRQSLGALARQFTVDLPDCLPILGYGLFSKGGHYEPRTPAETEDSSSLHLPFLLAKVLLALSLSFERASNLSLAICANLLRVLNEEGVRVRDLPLLSGVSKESLSMAVGILEKKDVVVIESDGRVKIARLTLQGQEAQDEYRKSLSVTEEQWRSRFGEDAIQKLRGPLESLAGDSTAQASPLFQGLVPYPENWRAKVPVPETLPHYPMVLHRGGYPDGS